MRNLTDSDSDLSPPHWLHRLAHANETGAGGNLWMAALIVFLKYGVGNLIALFLIWQIAFVRNSQIGDLRAGIVALQAEMLGAKAEMHTFATQQTEDRREMVYLLRIICVGQQHDDAGRRACQQPSR